MTRPLSAERIEVKDRIVGRAGMSRAMRKNVRAIGETVFATREGPPPAARMDWLVDDLDDFIAHAGPRARMTLWLCLTAISVLAPPLVFRFLPFRMLSFETRVHALERMERSLAGLAVFGAKAILCIIYYEHPESAALIGFDGGCLTDGTSS